MQPVITGSPLADVLIAGGTALAAVLGVVLARARKEPPKPGTPDAATLALADNTAALRKMEGQFQDNNKSFGEIVGIVRAMAHDMGEAKGHLSAIRDGVNRR